MRMLPFSKPSQHKPRPARISSSHTRLCLILISRSRRFILSQGFGPSSRQYFGAAPPLPTPFCMAWVPSDSLTHSSPSSNLFARYAFVFALFKHSQTALYRHSRVLFARLTYFAFSSTRVCCYSSLEACAYDISEIYLAPLKLSNKSIFFFFRCG
ncbi:hypothetical protein LX36DRAFT_75533 [Colletotrichum falcatum]|nr:hypothetical protein LX36DRAFT_75533 [Colletotrichum falcatum]